MTSDERSVRLRRGPSIDVAVVHRGLSRHRLARVAAVSPRYRRLVIPGLLVALLIVVLIASVRR